MATHFAEQLELPGIDSHDEFVVDTLVGLMNDLSTMQELLWDLRDRLDYEPRVWYAAKRVMDESAELWPAASGEAALKLAKSDSAQARDFSATRLAKMLIEDFEAAAPSVTDLLVDEDEKVRTGMLSDLHGMFEEGKLSREQMDQFPLGRSITRKPDGQLMIFYWEPKVHPADESSASRAS